MVLIRSFLVFFFLFCFSIGIATDTRLNVKMEGKAAELIVDLGGGSISDFRLAPDGLNPLQWDSWFFSPNADQPAPILPPRLYSFATALPSTAGC